MDAFRLNLFCVPAAPCGSRSTGSEGTVLSPNYPRNYTEGLSCVYEIAVPGEFGKFTALLIKLYYDVEKLYKTLVLLR